MEMVQITEKFTFSSQGLPSRFKDKVDKIVNVLNEPEINLKELMALIKHGIPDEVHYIKQICWKLILGYLPTTKSKWKQSIAKNQKTYQQFVRAFLPQEKYPDYPIVIDRKHPRWVQLQQDFELWEQIEKDTSRTHSDLSFFSNQVSPIMIPFLTGARKQKFRLMNGEDPKQYEQFIKNKQTQRITYRYHVMGRILFVYSKLNPKIKYVQGMNEILAPIFYLVNKHKSIDEQQEVSCFFMLNNAMSTIIELHIKDLDDSQTGITGKLKNINDTLLIIHPQIWKRLDDLKIDPFYYCFRWMTLLYAQQFQMFDVMRLWQSIFSRSNRILYMNFIAISILIVKQDLIMTNQFIKVLENLQNFKFDQNILGKILETANKLQQKYKNTDFEELAEKKKLKMKKNESSK